MFRANCFCSQLLIDGPLELSPARVVFSSTSNPRQNLGCRPPSFGRAQTEMEFVAWKLLRIHDSLRIDQLQGRQTAAGQLEGRTSLMCVGQHRNVLFLWTRKQRIVLLVFGKLQVRGGESTCDDTSYDQLHGTFIAGLEPSFCVTTTNHPTECKCRVTEKLQFLHPG